MLFAGVRERNGNQGYYVERQVENQGDTIGTVGFSVEIANLPGQ